MWPNFNWLWNLDPIYSPKTEVVILVTQIQFGWIIMTLCHNVTWQSPPTWYHSLYTHMILYQWQPPIKPPMKPPIYGHECVTNMINNIQIQWFQRWFPVAVTLTLQPRSGYRPGPVQVMDCPRNQFFGKLPGLTYPGEMQEFSHQFQWLQMCCSKILPSRFTFQLHGIV